MAKVSKVNFKRRKRIKEIDVPGPSAEEVRASVDAALASVPTPNRDAKLFLCEDGLWLVLVSRSSGKRAMIELSGEDHGPIVNKVIDEIADELQAEKNTRHK
jgi:hypothetical protein